MRTENSAEGRKRRYQLRFIPKLKSRLIIAMVLLAGGCKRFEERYDPFGKYEACEYRLMPSRVGEDVHDAVRRNDLRLLGHSVSGDLYSGVLASGIGDCDLRSAKHLNLNRPVRLSPGEGAWGTRAGLCRVALGRYEADYNRLMLASFPRARSYWCSPSRR